MKQPSLEITSLSAIAHIIEHRPDRVESLSLPPSPSPSSGRLQKLIASAQKHRVKIVPLKGGDPVLRVFPFEFAPWEYVEGVSALPRAMILVLDHIQDPQNFGAIVRSAEAFGVNAVVIPKDRSVTVTSAVYTASVGAVETVPIVCVTNINDRIVNLKKMEFWIVGTDVTEKSTVPWEIPTFEKIALVLGTEFEGIRPSTLSACDWISKIPISGKIESLNVSAAAAVLLYELNVRRRSL